MRPATKLIGSLARFGAVEGRAGPAGDPDSRGLSSSAGPLDRPVGSPRATRGAPRRSTAPPELSRTASVAPRASQCPSSAQARSVLRHRPATTFCPTTGPRPPAPAVSAVRPAGSATSTTAQPILAADGKSPTSRQRSVKKIRQQAAATAPTRRVAGVVDQCLLHFLLRPPSSGRPPPPPPPPAPAPGGVVVHNFQALGRGRGSVAPNRPRTPLSWSRSFLP